MKHPVQAAVESALRGAGAAGGGEGTRSLDQLEELPMQRRRFLAHIEKRKRKKRAAGDSVADKTAGGREAETGQDDDDDDEDDDNGDEDEELYDITLSSEFPVDRWYGREILDHSPEAINLDRAADGLNFLWNHNTDVVIGRLSNLRAKGGKLKARLRFSKIQEGRDKKTLVDEGMREVSLGYSGDEYEATPAKADEPTIVRWTRWTPMEGSLASVPADFTVGVGRSADVKFPIHRRSSGSEVSMEPKQGAAPAAGAGASPAVNTTSNSNAAEIVRLSILHNVQDRAAEWLERGLTIDQVKSAILDARASSPTGAPAPGAPTPSAGTGVDLPPADQRNYSYARAILVAANMADRDVSAAAKRNLRCLETEVSDELEKRMPQQYKRLGGMFIPMSLRNEGLREQFGSIGRSVAPMLQQRITDFLTRVGTIDSQTANTIKEVVFTEYGGELINILRNIALVVRMGARVLTGLSSPIAFPRQTQDVTATWVPENPGTDVADSNVKTDLVTISPRTLQAATKYSRQLLVQSSVDVEAMVRESIAAAHALAYDLAAIHGTGSNNQPLGVYNQPNVNTVDFGNASFGSSNKLAWTGVVEMERIVASANALLGALGFLTTPSIAADGKTTLKFPGAAVAQGGPIWEGTLLEGEMDGVRAMTTNQVAKTLGANGAASGGTYHGLIYGNWADLIIGQFGGAMEMIVDPYTFKKQGLIEVASFQMSDVAVRHPVSFSVGINLSP